MSADVKRKIAALLKMTKRSGCTEAEAMAAAEKAAQLMREHNLTETDVLFSQSSARSSTRGRSVRDRLWGALCANTNTALVYVDGSASFVGKGAAPDIAAYLFTVLNRAIDGAVAEFKSSTNYKRRKTIASRRGAVRDFTAAMVARLGSKLSVLFADQRSKEGCLAAVAARNEMFPGGRTVTPAAPKFRDRTAIGLGAAAGDRVSLAHGVGGQSKTLHLNP